MLKKEMIDKSKNIVVLVIIILVGVLICYSVKDIFNALLSTLVFYTLLRPFQIFLVDKKNWNAKFSAIMLIILSIFVIVIPVTGLTSMVVSKLSTFSFQNVNFDRIIPKAENFSPFELDFKSMVNDTVKSVTSFISNLVPTLITSAFSFFLNLVIMYFLLYFMLTERKTFESTLVKYLPFKRDDTLLFADEMRNITYSNVLGQSVIAVVQGVLTGFGLWIFRYEDPLFWGVITTFVSFVPVLGPPLIFVPMSIIQIVEGNQINGYGMLAYGLILVINIDNVLRFIIAKKIADTHPIITVIGVIIGVPLFGILGLVFGPLLLSYFVLLIRVFEKNRKSSTETARMP